MNNITQPVLYKKNSNGSINQWQIIVEDNTFYTIEGLKDGKLTQSKPTVCISKNVGKANETSGHEQALAEATSKMTKKIEKGYTKDINDVDTAKKFFSPMLAKKVLERKDKITYPAMVSYKIDGIRLVATKNGMFTRNGKPFVSCPHISEILKPVFDKHPNWIIDGELYSDEVPFEKIISLCRKTKPDQNDINESKKIIKYWIFDGVPDNKLMGYTDRVTLMFKEIKTLTNDNECLKYVTSTRVDNFSEVETYHDTFVRKGFEGLMLRDSNSPYENKRSNYLLKLKHFIDEEFNIVDIVEGTGNRSGMAGNLVCKMKDGRTFDCNIKGGAEFYQVLLSNKSKYIGKTATVRYQNLTEDGKPRFPVCITVGREDYE